MTSLQKLTDDQRKRFTQLRTKAREGVSAIFETAESLEAIRDEKLYRDEFDTFEEFCKVEFKLSKAYAYRMIDALTVKNSLPESVAGEIKNESQARALAPVPVDQRPKVIEEIKASGGLVTAQEIKSVASKMSPIGDKPTPAGTKRVDGKLKPVFIYDAQDYPVPKRIEPLWTRMTGEAAELMQMVKNIAGVLSSAKDQEDVGYRNIIQSSDALVAQLKQNVLTITPYAVCTTCQGQNEKACKFCKGTGYISKFEWDQLVDSDTKKMRLMEAKDRKSSK